MFYVNETSEVLLTSRTINRLQTFTYRTYYSDVTGLVVRSSKPVCIFVGINEKVKIGFRRPMLMSPVPSIPHGDKHVIPGIGGRNKNAGYIFRVVTNHNNTTVIVRTITSKYTVKYTFISTIRRGQFDEWYVNPADNTTFVDCSKPCVVVQ